MYKQQHPLYSLCPGLPGWASTRKVKPGFYWSKRQWVAVASAGPYAILHLTLDNTPPLNFYRPDALPATQPTVWKHWRHNAAAATCVLRGIMLWLPSNPMSTLSAHSHFPRQLHSHYQPRKCRYLVFTTLSSSDCTINVQLCSLWL